MFLAPCQHALTERSITYYMPDPLDCGCLCTAVYMLPYSSTPGRYYMYIFSCNYGEVVSFDTNTNTMTTLRPLPQWPNPDFCGQTSAQGVSRLLMLKPSNAYSPEVAMFGGTSRSSEWGVTTWVAERMRHFACDGLPASSSWQKDEQRHTLCMWVCQGC